MQRISSYSTFAGLAFVIAVGIGSLPALSAESDEGGGNTEAPAAQPAPLKKHGKTPPPAAEPANGEEDATAPSQDHKANEQAVARSATSLEFEDRLSLGTSVGWGIVKPRIGKWQGVGMSSIDGSWRKSPKPDGKLFITARYAPYAGVWTVDNRDYDTTAHGFFAGAQWLLPFGVGSAELKAGVELGYLLVYAKPQDQAAADGSVKGGKVAAGCSAEMDWTVLNKLKVGPVMRLSGGGFSAAFLGAAANFVF